MCGIAAIFSYRDGPRVDESELLKIRDRMTSRGPDGAGIWATVWDHALSVRVTADAVLVASEPVDPFPDWTAVPDRRLVVTPVRHSGA